MYKNAVVTWGHPESTMFCKIKPSSLKIDRAHDLLGQWSSRLMHLQFPFFAKEAKQAHYHSKNISENMNLVKRSRQP